METLESVFPAVPGPALQRVLEICDGDVETASEWILENNWRDLLDGDDDNAVDADGNGDDNAHTPDRAGRDETSERAATGAGDAAATAGFEQQSHTHEQTRAIPVSMHQSGAVASLNAQAAAAPGGETNPGLTISGDSVVTHAGGGALPFPHANSTNASRHHHHHHHQHHGHFAGSSSTGAAAAPAPALVGRALGRHDDRDFDSGGEHDGESDDYEEDEDEDDEDDDDDDDDDDAHSYYDSGDDAFYHSGGVGGVLPLAKRVKITADSDAAAAVRDPKQEMYWVAFDGQVVRKTLIELLNTTLSKLAHSKVTLLNKSTKHIEELEAKEKLVSVLETTEASNASARVPTATAVATAGSSRSGMDHILNDMDTKPAAVAAVASVRDAADTKVLPPSSSAAAANGQKRKRSADESAESPRGPLGFFAHFFSVSDLDMIWRSVMHAHLFNARFGEMIEFHTASCGAFNKRDFDELMHIQTNMASSRAASLGLSPAAALKCCLILPCTATESEIFRVGKHLHSLLKLQGSLYYRTLDDSVVGPSLPSSTATNSILGVTLASASSITGDSLSTRSARMDLLNEDGKMTEDSFRRFARYRIKKEEQEALESKDAHALTPDHFLAYQQQRKVEYCLEALESNGWDRRLSS